MSLEDIRKQKSQNSQKDTKPGLKRTLEGVVERVRDGLEELANELERGLRPAQPQPIPIPVPSRRPRRR